MSYTLYTAENCHQCGEILEYIEESGIECRKVNVDQEDEKPPVVIFAFPALFKDGELIGYGTDIRLYFAKKNQA